ncbi:retrovirus-related pol polyprotein from transposon TNT 1-94, partial [Tanacetum coccineum]
NGVSDDALRLSLFPYSLTHHAIAWYDHCLPKLKYVRDQLCSSCEMSKAKRSSFAIPSSKGRLNLLHMDLCGPMRVASINGKKYILVIVDDYSRYTWTLFLRSKDETPEVLKDQIKPRSSWQRRLITADQASVFMAKTNDKWRLLKITLQAPFLNVQKTFEQRSSSLVLHQMTSDHNRSELRIHDHSNEQSSSKLVPKVVP